MIDGNFIRAIALTVSAVFLANGSSAASLSGIDFDETAPVLSGTSNFLPDSGSASIASFGPTVGGHILSGSVSGTTGNIDFVTASFPPVTFASGQIEDTLFETDFLTILFRDSASSDLFVVEARGAGLPATGQFLAPVFNAGVEVFEATDIGAIPLPASGILLVIGMAGLTTLGRRRA